MAVKGLVVISAAEVPSFFDDEFVRNELAVDLPNDADLTRFADSIRADACAYANDSRVSTSYDLYREIKAVHDFALER